MRYLSVFISKQPTKPIAVVDLTKPERVSVIDAIYYCDFHGGHAFISNYKNISLRLSLTAEPIQGR